MSLNGLGCIGKVWIDLLKHLDSRLDALQEVILELSWILLLTMLEDQITL